MKVCTLDLWVFIIMELPSLLDLMVAGHCTVSVFAWDLHVDVGSITMLGIYGHTASIRRKLVFLASLCRCSPCAVREQSMAICLSP